MSNGWGCALVADAMQGKGVESCRSQTLSQDPRASHAPKTGIAAIVHTHCVLSQRDMHTHSKLFTRFAGGSAGGEGGGGG